MRSGWRCPSERLEERFGPYRADPVGFVVEQLGHANIDQTMKYARFHPDYSDVQEYFDRVDRQLGLGPRDPDPEPDDKLQRAAELLDLDPDRLAGTLDTMDPDAGNSSGNTPDRKEPATTDA